MRTSLKLKYNIHTGEFSAITGEGNDLSKGLTISDIAINLNAQNVPTVVLTCLVFDDLEIELADADIEINELHTGHIKEDQAAKVERYENELRSKKLQEVFSKEKQNA